MTISKTQVFGSQMNFSEAEQETKIRKKVKQHGFVGYEIYGIGGLGAKTAAIMWGDCTRDEKNIRLSSWFLSGTERRGSEVLMKGTIVTKDNFDRFGYEPKKKDLFVFFSEDTIKSDFERYHEVGQSIFSKASGGATVIVNSNKSAVELVKDFPYLSHFDVFAVNADAKIPNMQMLAATILATGISSYESLENRIKDKFGSRSEMIFKQIESASMSYQPQLFDENTDFSCVKIDRSWVPDGGYGYPDWGSSGGPHMIKGMKLGINYYIDMEDCNRCERCYDVCPENAIRGFWPDTEAEQAPGALKNYGGEGFFIVEEYCKSCGLCESVCTFKNAIKTEVVNK